MAPASAPQFHKTFRTFLVEEYPFSDLYKDFLHVSVAHCGHCDLLSRTMSRAVGNVVYRMIIAKAGPAMYRLSLASDEWSRLIANAENFMALKLQLVS